MSEFLGPLYNKAMDFLQQKYLIKLRPDVKTGVLSSRAVEILTFPIYEQEVFSPDIIREDEHRRNYKDISWIQIPSVLMDRGYLKGLHVEALYALLWLYYKLSFSKYWGVNYEFIYSEAEPEYIFYKNFGSGFSKKIYGKECIELMVSPKYFRIKDSVKKQFQGELAYAVNELIERGLFTSHPIVIEHDEEDPDIKEIKGEVYRGMVHYKDDDNCLNKYLILKGVIPASVSCTEK